MSKILVDTSVWIDFFSGKIFVEAINELLSRGLVATCGVVKSEFLPFLKRERDSTVRFFSRFDQLSFPETLWDEVVVLQRSILSSGENRLALPDLMITALCLHHDCPLFTKDKDFLRIKDVVGLELYDWKS